MGRTATAVVKNHNINSVLLRRLVECLRMSSGNVQLVHAVGDLSCQQCRIREVLVFVMYQESAAIFPILQLA